MNKLFIKETERIYRLKVPFMSVYTSVFLIKTETGNALMDCATYDSDVDEHILPALKEKGLSLEDINYLIISHNHGDHVGGKNRLLELNPNLQVVQTVMPIFLQGIEILELKGHTLDCIGVLDVMGKTLITCDGLQGAGIKQYRCLLDSKEEYIKTIEKIKNDTRIKNILFSHAYEPWNKDGVFSREQVEQILQDCIKEI